ncbi:MAG: hypothetical protein IMY71_01045, partial [Bacteroidetes bacterium]|nr:hypothetical protein [Bacteroidota bacterium]
MKKKAINNKFVKLLSIISLIFIFATPSFSTEIGDPLNVLSHAYGFFSGDYYTWATCRGLNEDVEIFVEDAMWDSTITIATNPLPSNAIICLEKDDQSGIYLGTAQGLAYYNGNSFEDLSNYISDRVIDLAYNEQILWLAANTGLYKYDGNEITLIYNETEALPISAVGVSGDAVWFGTALGLKKWTVDSIESFPAVPSINSPVSNVIRDIEIDEQGNPWLATDKGVCFLDEVKGWGLISSLDNLISDDIYTLVLTEEDEIWVGTDKGLALYKNDSTYSNYKVDNSALTDGSTPINSITLVNSICWIASNDGAFRLEGKWDWTQYPCEHANYLKAHTNQIFNTDVINDIVALNGNLYLATPWGLSKFDPINNSWETWRGPYTDETVYADSALVAEAMKAWSESTPSVGSEHFFYNGVAQALGVDAGGDTLGILEEATKFFGDVSDVDKNGKVTVVLMDIRDYWDDSANELDGLGDLTFDGYFDTRNLYSEEPTMRKDLLYIDIRRQSLTEVKMALAKTLTKHILYNHDPDEQTWLTEGFGMLSEVLTGYTDQSIGFKGFDKLTYPCQNSILLWERTNPYPDQQFSELLLLFTAEKYQNGNDGGLGILLDIAQNNNEQGIVAFNTALSNYGTQDRFSDLFFNLGISAIIEQQKKVDADHPIYNFSYYDIGSITNYNTIYWGMNNQDSPPYLNSLSQWSSRIFNAFSLWRTQLKEFGFIKFNGSDNNHFRIGIVLNNMFTPDTTSRVIEIQIDEYNENMCAFLDTLDENGYKSYSVFIMSDMGDGSGVTQMVMSQDVVSPDKFGGIKVGVIQNPLNEKLIDLYTTSFEPLYIDVGDASFVDDGGFLQIAGSADTSVVTLEKYLEDESYYEFFYTVDFDTITHKANVSEYYMYHAEYTIPEDGDYTLSVDGQDLSGNDAEADIMNFSVTTVAKAAKTAAHKSGEFSIRFQDGSLKEAHTIIVSPVENVPESCQLGKKSTMSEYGFNKETTENEAVSKAYKAGPQYVELEKPVIVRFKMDELSETEQVGIFKLV